MPFEQKTGFACRAGPVFLSYFLLHFSLPAPLHFVHKFSQGLDFIRSQPTNLQNGHLRQIKIQRLFLAFAALHGIICGTLLLGIGSQAVLRFFPSSFSRRCASFAVVRFAHSYTFYQIRTSPALPLFRGHVMCCLCALFLCDRRRLPCAKYAFIACAALLYTAARIFLFTHNAVDNSVKNAYNKSGTFFR